MTTLYSSIEAAEIRCAKPERCSNCQHEEFTRHTYGVGSVSEEKPVKEMYWMCDYCGEYHNSILYVAKHSEYPILTEEQSNWMVDQRWAKDLTLKIIAENTGISVSRLSDIERRHNAPTPDEWQKIQEVLK